MDANIIAFMTEQYAIKDAKPHYYQYVKNGGTLGFDAWYITFSRPSPKR